MYVDVNGKRLGYKYLSRDREYALDEPNPWNEVVLGTVVWNGHPGELYGFWFHPHKRELRRFKLPFELILDKPKVYRCNQIRRVS